MRLRPMLLTISLSTIFLANTALADSCLPSSRSSNSFVYTAPRGGCELTFSKNKFVIKALYPGPGAYNVIFRTTITRIPASSTSNCPSATAAAYLGRGWKTIQKPVMSCSPGTIAIKGIVQKYVDHGKRLEDTSLPAEFVVEIK